MPLQGFGVVAQIPYHLGLERHRILEDPDAGLIPDESFADRHDDSIDGNSLAGLQWRWAVEDGQVRRYSFAFPPRVVPLGIEIIDHHLGPYPIRLTLLLMRHGPN